MLERWRQQAFVLYIVLTDQIHKRARVLEVEHDLPGFRALQGLLVKFFDRSKTVFCRQPVEAIEKVNRRFLILKGIFVGVVTLPLRCCPRDETCCRVLILHALPCAHPQSGEKSSTPAETNTGRGYVVSKSPALSTWFKIIP